MIRQAVIFSILIISILTFAVFKVEYYVRELRGELTQINEQVLQFQEDIHVLNAEWAYLNQPQRIARLADRYLKTDYINYAQVKDMDAIDNIRLAGRAVADPKTLQIARALSITERR